jgi:2-polyprenyl-3-methyl-5-hydroxy-6-metoxy-1,4-benzoquinol methylase
MTTTNSVPVQKPPLRTPGCPACESEHVGLAFKKYHVDYYACRDCRFTFIFPWPDELTLQNHYDDYGRRYYSNNSLKDFLLSPKHYHREIGLLSRAAKLGTLLDVGCSVGGFVRAASELGYAAEGIDISPSSVAVGQEAGLRIRSGDFLCSTFTSKFDVITMWATLEHLPAPNRYVERAWEWLRPGGVLLASVPNFSGITQRLVGSRDRYVGIDHLNYWTARGFASYLGRFGFEIVETVTCGFNPITLMKDWLNPGQSIECEQMAVEQTSVASLKNTWVGHAHHVVEKLLNLGLLGDQVAVAARVPDQKTPRSQKPTYMHS